MSYRFVKHDGGRSASTHPKEKNDCTVRALVLVTAPLTLQRFAAGAGFIAEYGTHYDDVHRLLKDAGSRATNSGVGFDRFMYGHLDPVIGEPQTLFGWTATRQTFPAVKGQRRMNPPTFVKRFPKGRYVVSTARHVFAVIDGVVYDTHPVHDDRCIYSAWTFTRA